MNGTLGIEHPQFIVDLGTTSNSSSSSSCCCCCCCRRFHINSHNQVGLRGHRTGSNHARVEEYIPQGKDTKTKSGSLDYRLYTHILVFFFAHFYFSGQAVVTGLVPSSPCSCLQSSSRIGFSNPTVHVDFSSSAVANSRSRAFRKSIGAQETPPPTNLYECALGGT